MEPRAAMEIQISERNPERTVSRPKINNNILLTAFVDFA